MHSVDQAIARLLATVQPIADVEQLGIDQCCGAVLAKRLVSGVNVPPADNSAMDGYALRHDSWHHADTPIPVSQRVPAGAVAEKLAPGTAARIFTGAEIPPDADTVVIQENCSEIDGSVLIKKMPEKGANIRPRAQDVAKGQVVLEAGRRLRPQETGLLASLGMATVPACRRLRVAVLSNGSELVEPGEPVAGGQIYNSNRYLLNALLRGWGFEVMDLGIVRDDPAEIQQLLGETAGKADVIVSSGGVSVGEEDHIRNVVAGLGALELWKVSIKPGKPFAFGHVCGTPFLGLPGNPASVLVTALIVARPYLWSLQGMSNTEVQPMQVRATFSRKAPSRTEYLRVRHSPKGLEIYPSQSSGILFSSVWGNGLAVQPEGHEIHKGDTIDFLPYALLL
ncbi:MAG: molybdopterin molybdotransferase MoeA [Xanthomonadales bacterium]|nr:molybdopterin molybdotransferase MoeA [Xanthomonadales bacterium]